jgi:hypothetical protein
MRLLTLLITEVMSPSSHSLLLVVLYAELSRPTGVQPPWLVWAVRLR